MFATLLFIYRGNHIHYFYLLDNRFFTFSIGLANGTVSKILYQYFCRDVTKHIEPNYNTETQRSRAKCKHHA